MFDWLTFPTHYYKNCPRSGSWTEEEAAVQQGLLGRLHRQWVRHRGGGLQVLAHPTLFGTHAYNILDWTNSIFQIWILQTLYVQWYCALCARIRLVYFTSKSRAFLYNILEDFRDYIMTITKLIWPLQHLCFSTRQATRLKTVRMHCARKEI